MMQGPRGHVAFAGALALAITASVRVRALEQALETKAEVTSSRLTTVTIEVEGDRFVIRP